MAISQFSQKKIFAWQKKDSFSRKNFRFVSQFSFLSDIWSRAQTFKNQFFIFENRLSNLKSWFNCLSIRTPVWDRREARVNLNCISNLQIGIIPSEKDSCALRAIIALSIRGLSSFARNSINTKTESELVFVFLISVFWALPFRFRTQQDSEPSADNSQKGTRKSFRDNNRSRINQIRGRVGRWASRPLQKLTLKFYGLLIGCFLSVKAPSMFKFGKFSSFWPWQKVIGLEKAL